MSQYPGQQPQDGYAQQQAAPGQEYADQTSTPPGVAPGPAPGPAAGRKKRRDYAGQAYEFGAGGNAAATPVGHQDDNVGVGGYSLQQNAAGYAQGGYAQNPTAVQPGQTPMYGQADPGVGGYQPPAPQYPTQPAQPGAGVAGMTQQFGQMDMSQKPQIPQQPQQQAQQQQPGRPPQLNTLYPSDLQNQPLNVAELDYPPPPAILPANVSSRKVAKHEMLTRSDQCNSIAIRQLPAQVRQINTECCSYYALSAQEIEITLCACHPAIHISS